MNTALGGGATDTQPPTAPSGADGDGGEREPDQSELGRRHRQRRRDGLPVERCPGAACTNFAQIGTPASTAYSDTGRRRARRTATGCGPWTPRATSARTRTRRPRRRRPGRIRSAGRSADRLTATAASASQINLSWGAATDNVGVDRDTMWSGAAGRLAPTSPRSGRRQAPPTRTRGSPANTTYQIPGARAWTAPATSEPVLEDRHGATTQTAPDTQAPDAPTGLTATAVGPTQVNLSWTASTDNVGVTGYRVERCQGVRLRDLRRGRDAAGTTFSDTGRTPSTTYSYRVRATDAAGNLGPYSGTASATTPAATDTQAPTAPGRADGDG